MTILRLKYKTLCLIALSLFSLCANAQIYFHDFGTVSISSHPYTVTPSVFDSHLSGSSWTNSVGSWTSTGGASGEAIRLTTATTATITLTFLVESNYAADIESFSFWSQRSNLGPQNWSVSVNGVGVGSGVTAATGAATGIQIPSSSLTGLTGTITVEIALSGQTGNGTFRLDDFLLNGSVYPNCSGATVTSVFPQSGPQNTLVTIDGVGFLSGSGTSAVTFNGTPAIFTVVSDTQIKAYAPANAEGNILVLTDGCPASAPVDFDLTQTVGESAVYSDIFISEIYDETPGDAGIIELYNGTGAPVDLSGYTIRRYGDIGGSSFGTIYLTGIIPDGATYLIGIGNWALPCGITEAMHYAVGFNGNDEFEMYNPSGTLIDNVHVLTSSAGFSIRRDPDAVAPKPNFSAPDWTLLTNQDCSEIGTFEPAVSNPPTVTNPVSEVACEGEQVQFSAPLSSPAGYEYQWKKLDASGNWVSLSDVAPYSGVNSATLIIDPAGPGLNPDQFYCEMISGGTTVVSQAAQLELTDSILPEFNLQTSYCEGAVTDVLPLVSDNGITGSWSPSSISNTVSGSYTFTPDSGQCASPVTLLVTIDPARVPDFATTMQFCSGASVPVLQPTSPNGITGVWSPSSISNTTSGSYTFTPNSGQCASAITLTVTIDPALVPDFATAMQFCSGVSVPTLQATSPNGITGVWSPSSISNTTSGTYTFTPDSGQCASPVTLSVTIDPALVPDFATTMQFCSGASVPVLQPASPNGITGSWSPSSISNTTSGSYTFTPDSGQCASPITLTVTIDPALVPDFATAMQFCSGASVPALQSTSPNGITGVWSPSSISNTASGTYTFTPDSGQCASEITLTVTIDPALVPDFATTMQFCSGASVPVLQPTSPNGITGSWSPSSISNTASGTYTFTPDSGQCASEFTLTVTIDPALVPDFATTMQFCSGASVPLLQPTSPNGITGSWSPSNISNTASGTYTFTPDSGQCASPITLSVTIDPALVPDFATTMQFCSGASVPVLQPTSPSGVTGSWSPSNISNTTSGTYTFTPDSGQCASAITLTVTIDPALVPDFVTAMQFCSGASVPVLQPTSPNGITGSWSPSSISNTSSGTYTFTPDSGQCASEFTLTVTIDPALVPDFATTMQFCSGASVPVLQSTSPNGITGSWSPSSISNTASGTYTFTPDSGQCASPVTLSVAIDPALVPDFATAMQFCSGASVPVLQSTSPNGITGSWSPSSISNTASGTYTFTPDSGQCASPVTLSVTIDPALVPDFATTMQFCSGASVPVLQPTSPNGIMGSWSPSNISNTSSGTYTFTPDSGQCASAITLSVTIDPALVPDFVTTMQFCSGASVPVLQPTSPNGITGSWSPSSISNTASGIYTFTPDSGQCASPITLSVTIDAALVPDFATTMQFCSGTSVPVLQPTSPNGITGSWSPSSISNTTSGSYTFTPDSGQCASPITLSVTIDPALVPDFATAMQFCSGASVPVLQSTSPNGITGSWSPSSISNITSGTYTFTPDSGQCASPVTLSVTIGSQPEPVLGGGSICVDANGNVLQSALLDSGFPVAGYTFQWTRNGQPEAFSGPVWSVSQPGIYQVTVTNIASGCSGSASAEVVTAVPVSAIVAAPSDFSGNRSIRVEASGGSGDFVYQIDGGMEQYHPVFFPVEPGAHQIRVADVHGCSETTLEVFFLDYPHYFTPNGDGFSDWWNIKGISDQPARISIFDRYGKLLKVLKPSDSSGWDGTYNGKPMPSTDYWFTLEYYDRDGYARTFRAHFALKR